LELTSLVHSLYLFGGSLAVYEQFVKREERNLSLGFPLLFKVKDTKGELKRNSVSLA